MNEGNKKILVTGATGFIGDFLSRYLVGKGWIVVGTTRLKSDNLAHFVAKYRQENPSGCVDFRSYRIGEPISENLLEGISAIVHLAHDFSDEDGSLNIDGTLMLVKEGLARGIENQIFVSSYSARSDAITTYGKIKYQIEQKLDSRVKVLRPGLVVGSGGLFKRIRDTVKILPLIPQIGMKSQRIPIIDVDDLCIITDKCLSTEGPVRHNVFQSDLVFYRDFVFAITKFLGVKRFVLPIPASLIIAAVRVLSFLRIPSPITEENVLGLLHNQAFEPVNHLSCYKIQEKSLSDMVAKHF